MFPVSAGTCCCGDLLCLLIPSRVPASAHRGGGREGGRGQVVGATADAVTAATASVVLATAIVIGADGLSAGITGIITTITLMSQSPSDGLPPSSVLHPSGLSVKGHLNLLFFLHGMNCGNIVFRSIAFDWTSEYPHGAKHAYSEDESLS